jgi:hypothetical protein
MLSLRQFLGFIIWSFISGLDGIFQFLGLDSFFAATHSGWG